MEQKPFPFAVCVKCCNLDNDLTIDQNYNSKSENAQSGKAVAEALSSKLDYKVGYESELDNYKDGSELYLIKGSHPETVGGLFEFNPYYLFVLGMGGIINTESGEPVITHTQYKFVVDGMYKRHYTVTETDTDIIEKWTKWESVVFESDKVTELTSESTDEQYPSAKAVFDNITAVLSIAEGLSSNKADRPMLVVDKEATEYTINLAESNNHIIRLGELEKLSVVTGFEKLEDIPEDYALNVSFSSGETPTIIDYAEAYYVSWVGVDCLNNNRVSSFQPLGDKRYDVVFYKDGRGLVGLVNGYIASIPLPPPIIG